MIKKKNLRGKVPYWIEITGIAKALLNNQYT